MALLGRGVVTYGLRAKVEVLDLWNPFNLYHKINGQWCTGRHDLQLQRATTRGSYLPNAFHPNYGADAKDDAVSSDPRGDGTVGASGHGEATINLCGCHCFIFLTK